MCKKFFTNLFLQQQKNVYKEKACTREFEREVGCHTKQITTCSMTEVYSNDAVVFERTFKRSHCIAETFRG